MKKIIIKGIVKFTVDEEHPDYQYMDEKQRHGINTYSDTYYFDVYDPVLNPGGFYAADDVEGMKEYIKNDLALVAGGGYNTEHIHNVKFRFC